MPQPTFWLKITPAYVIENFEALLQYVAAYNFSPDEHPDSDFNRTVNFLMEVAEDLAESLDKCGPEDTPTWDIDKYKALRITAAAILAEYKRGGTPHSLILALIKMTLLTHPVSPEYRRSYANTINACARKARITDISIQFSDLDPARFTDATLSSRIAYIKWDTSKAPRSFYEGVGTVIFDANSAEITPLNHDNILSTERKRKKSLDVAENVFISEIDARRPNRQNIVELQEWWPGLIRDLREMKPSRPKKLKRYSVNDHFDVRIVRRSGIKIECESIDPDYETVEGKILIDPINLGVSRDNLLLYLQPGDILPAEYVDGPEFAFNVAQEEELDFKKDLVANMPKSYVNAIFVSEYSFGTRWMSDIGVTVNVINRYNDYIDLDAHRQEGARVKIRILETKRDKNDNVVCNGVFLPESEQNLSDTDPTEFRREGGNYITQNLISWLKSNFEDADGDITYLTDIHAPRRAVSVLALLTLQNAENTTGLASADRLAMFIGAAALFECAYEKIGVLTAKREIAYQAAISAFAMDEDPKAIQLFVPSEIVEAHRSKEQLHIIEILKRYRDLNRSIRPAYFSAAEQMRLLEQLVDASNTLLDKIDEAEISRIKKAIAARLGVGDLYKDINTHRTFYGFESDTLEFKISCARPPQNMQSDDPEKNAKTQAFVILKTICAFLNSESGGDLLIGVNDEGYAVGVRNDIDVLSEMHYIAEPNPDRVRVYIKNIIDRAFVSNDGNVSGNAITAGYVNVNLEQSKENQFIIRVRITPYPYDVVKIKKDYTIPGQKNVFFRSSATSMPLDADGIRNIRIQKINRLDANESKIATILEAIDRKKQVMINNYHSRSGLESLRVEPHLLLPDNSAFQAFDNVRKQMRLFRLSRIGSIEILNSSWDAEKKHRTLPVDIFGTMQSDEHRGTQYRIKMTDYAMMLLKEEFPAARSSEYLTVEANTDADSSRFPQIVTLDIYEPEGITRFLRGLPDDTRQL